MSYAIKVERLSKVYDIRGVGKARRDTLVGEMGNFFKSPFRGSRNRIDDELSGANDHHWALRDVDFEIPEGKAVGIIGHNGAGKSTLLKILARITQPTHGQARVRGRMASLLEVGTGFHPDLTGRDNVLFNGAILGMSRREIERRFDEIVDFSGVEAYIDTPIKHYSSGMKVRLAFAVAAHLDPDILVVDEVLAVGDAAFQRKCLNRIEEVGSTGRTVLYVSHQLTTVARFCQLGIVLDHGEKVFHGGALDAIAYYSENLGFTASIREWQGSEIAPGSEDVKLRAVRVLGSEGLVAGPVEVGQAIDVEIEYKVINTVPGLTPAVHVYDASGVWAFSSIDRDPAYQNQVRRPGIYRSRVRIEPHLLNEGTYSVSASLATLEPLHDHCFTRDCVGFNVYDAVTGESARGVYEGPYKGVVRPMLNWFTERE